MEFGKFVLRGVVVTKRETFSMNGSTFHQIGVTGMGFAHVFNANTLEETKDWPMLNEKADFSCSLEPGKDKQYKLVNPQFVKLSTRETAAAK